MEVVRAIALAHYSAGPDDVKKLAYEFFRALDTDEDERVSLYEFLELMNHEGHTRLANPYFFRALDRDWNGFLDFWEVLTLYYIIKSERPICNCCGILVIDTFFSCVECFNSSEGSYSLCIHCYRSNLSKHNHYGRQQFLDTFTLLQTKKRPTPENHNIQGSPRVWPPSAEPSCSSTTPQGQGSTTAIVPARRMDVVRAIADAHYRAGSDAVKSMPYAFFGALDTDRDGRVSLHEFLVFMNHQGHTQLANPNFFRELDRDGNGFLDFWEVLTLYYVIKSERPICQCCRILVIDTFFSCVECFNSSEGSYSLCIHCYRSKKIPHYHNDDRQQFLDTFTLLQTMKRPTPKHHNIQERPWEWQPSAEPSWSSITPQGQGSTAVVPATRMSGWKAALAALEIGLAIGSISATQCTIL